MAYTENEIKAWFDEMKKKYPNSEILQHLEAVEYMMFNKVFDDRDCLEKIKKRVDNFNSLQYNKDS